MYVHFVKLHQSVHLELTFISLWRFYFNENVFLKRLVKRVLIKKFFFLSNGSFFFLS